MRHVGYLLLAQLGWLALGCGRPVERDGGEEPGAARSRQSQSIQTDVWEQRAKLVPSTAVANGYVGAALALQADTLLVSSSASAGSPSSGVATVFLRVGPSWQEQAALKPADPKDQNYFGQKVALDGNTAAVSSLASPGGAVHVFVRSGSSWSEQAKLTTAPSTREVFGYSLALSLNSLLVGSPSSDRVSIVAGSVYVRVRNGASWTEQARLRPSVAQDNLFGRSISLSGDVALVGAGSDASRRGSAYVFQRTGSSWSEQARLLPLDGVPEDRFGWAVALAGGRAFVGAPSARVAGVPSGAVYVFTRSGTSWAEQIKVFPSTGPLRSGDELGSSLFTDGDHFATGAPGADGPELKTGTAHWFAWTGEWVADGLAASKQLKAFDRHGESVAFSGHLLAAGAPLHSTSIPDSGAVFVYGYGLPFGTHCTTSDQCASGACSDGVCCDRVCTGACETCLAVEGSSVDGVCSIFPRTSESKACHPLACDGKNANCPTNCSVGGCAWQFFCSSTSLQCEPLKLFGESCAEGIECFSGICADGVCCDRECRGCEACRVTFTGIPEGLCGAVLPGIDPHDVCAADPAFPLSCQADGMCDGGGQCRSFAPPTTPCGATSCQAGSITGKLCNGLGGCGDGIASCAPYLCLAGACTAGCQNDADCANTAYCDAFRVCRNRLANGLSCARPEECSSGHCVDGVCCNSACAGQCEWCADRTTRGTCTAAVGDAPPGRLACSDGTESNVCERARCDGMVRDQCAAFVGNELVCAPSACADGHARPEGRCDGKGACNHPQAVECFPYACAETNCKRECTTAADCASGAQCTASGACVTDAICDGDHTLTVPSGEEENCSPYRCNAKGTCFSACASTKQCVAGYICASSGRCVTASPANDSTGCALGRVRGARWAWLLLGLGGLRLLRRRSFAPRRA